MRTSAQVSTAIPLTGNPTNQIIIKYKTGSSIHAIGEPLVVEQVRALGRMAKTPLTHARIIADGSHVLRLDQRLPLAEVQSIADALEALPEIEFAAPDQVMSPLLVPNDPQYGSQWHYFEQYGINLPAAWDFTTGSTGVRVAVIDTGITDHPDLAGRWVGGYDFVSDSRMGSDGNGRDADPHDPGNWITGAEAGAGYFLGCAVTALRQFQSIVQRLS